MRNSVTVIKTLSLSLILVLGLYLNANSAVSLPTANITGDLVTTTGGLSFSGGGATALTQVNYLDTSFAQTNIPGVESIIYSTVTLTGATRAVDPNPTDNIYPFTNAQLEVRGPDSFLYICATLKNIELINFGDGTIGINPQLNASDPATLNLSFDTADNPSNGLFNDATTHVSRFIDEWRTALGTGKIAGMTVIAMLNGNPAGTSNSNILTGVLDGSPITTPPPPPTDAGIRSMGYWKTHDAERSTYSGTAFTKDLGVFSSAANIEYYVSIKGKKDMLTKAKQELAALLLNLASNPGLENQILTTPQLELIDPVLNNPLIQEDTVGEALTDISTVILTPNRAGELERVKDLAESINTME